MMFFFEEGQRVVVFTGSGMPSWHGTVVGVDGGNAVDVLIERPGGRSMLTCTTGMLEDERQYAVRVARKALAP